jgi:hypothetical protein
VANGNKTLILSLNRSLRRGERGRGGKRAGKQANDHGNEAILRFDGGTKAYKVANADACRSRKTACKDNDHAEKNVGFEVSLEVTEEFGACNEAYGSNEENKTEAFQKRKTGLEIVGLGGACENEIAKRINLEEKRAKEQSDNEYACVAKRNSFYGNSAEQIAEHKNRKYNEQ